MLLRIALFVVMAVGLVGFGSVAWLSLRRPPAPAAIGDAVAPPPRHGRVLAAARTLRAGTLLKPEDVTAQAMPPNRFPQARSPTLRRAQPNCSAPCCAARSPPATRCCRRDVVRAGDRGFLAAVLGPGMRGDHRRAWTRSAAPPA